jgi:hypothetical protein
MNCIARAFCVRAEWTSYGTNFARCEFCIVETPSRTNLANFKIVVRHTPRARATHALQHPALDSTRFTKEMLDRWSSILNAALSISNAASSISQVSSLQPKRATPRKLCRQAT